MSCRKPRAARAGSTPIRCCCAARGGGDVTDVGLCPDGAAVAARRRPPTERRCCSKCRAESMAARRAVDRTEATKTVWFYDADRLLRRRWSGSATQPSKTRSSTCRPTSRSMRIAAGSRSSRARPGRSAARPIRATRCSGSGSTPSSPASRDFAVLFEPGAAPRRCKASPGAAVGWCCRSSTICGRCSRSLTPSDGGWARAALAGLPDIGVVSVWPLDVESRRANGDLLASAQDPLTPPSLMLIAPGQAAADAQAVAAGLFDADGLVVTRHEAVSVDGERIPYVQTGPAGETGDAPVHLTGYGGFAISPLPYYNSAIGKLWLERGGTSVTANIRGGGEFGAPWHEAGRGAGKRLSHDDFAAVAADLVRRGVTAAGPHRRRGRLERRHPDHQHADPLSRALRRAVLHHPADRHAPLCEAAGRRELDRRIRRPRQAGGVGVAARPIRPITRPCRGGPIRRS